MPMDRALLLTGRPGCGKTTLLRKVVGPLGSRAGGFYTAEVREAGRRVGFGLVTLDGERAVLAHVRFSSPYRVGQYGVDMEALERVGVAALRRACRLGLLVVVDEIGKMELCSPAFRQAVLEALQQERMVLGTIMASPHPWADQVKRDPRVRVLLLTRETWEDVYATAVRWVEENLPSGTAPEA